MNRGCVLRIGCLVSKRKGREKEGRIGIYSNLSSSWVWSESTPLPNRRSLANTPCRDITWWQRTSKWRWHKEQASLARDYSIEQALGFCESTGELWWCFPRGSTHAPSLSSFFFFNRKVCLERWIQFLSILSRRTQFASDFRTMHFSV